MRVTPLESLEIRLSATIERGVTDNRVRIGVLDHRRMKYRTQAALAGRCLSCLKRPARPGYVTCEACVESAMRAYEKKRREAAR